MRVLRIGIACLLAITVLAGTALGGGTAMVPYRESYLPGDTVVMRGEVSPGELGWIDDGPFLAYIRTDADASDGAATFPHISDSDIYVGDLELTPRADSWLSVSLTFTIPGDLAEGQHWIVYCNNPCTDGLGDLIGGWFTVRRPPPPRPAHLIPYPLFPI